MFKKNSDLMVQPGSHCGRHMWHYSSLKNFGKMYITRAKNVCNSQNNIKPFFQFLIDLQCVFASPTICPGNY